MKACPQKERATVAWSEVDTLTANRVHSPELRRQLSEKMKAIDIQILQRRER
jgi:hypothetical protein